MKIEQGKFYKLRGGYKYRNYATDCCGDYPNHGAYIEDEEWLTISHTEYGQHTKVGTSQYDIIAEWVEPHPAEKWEVDATVFVSNDQKSWYPKHFAMYRDGLIYCWEFGTTSFSADRGQIDLGWKYAKLAEK